MNEHNQHLAEAREDERTRHLAAKRIVANEAAILAREHSRMTERRDLVDRMDDTGFAPGSLI